MSKEDLTRRNFLLGKVGPVRPDTRADAERAWRGSRTPASSTSSTSALPKVISWLDDSVRAFASETPNDNRQSETMPLLRPPGALVENEFLEACTRCGDCVKACEPGAISMAPERMRSAAGTPIIDAMQAPCLLCEGLPCITACEPGALRAEAPAALGTAFIQALDCLNRLGSSCTVCVEQCPIPGALTFVDNVPVVSESLCTGCGQCQYACPAPINAIAILPSKLRPSRAEVQSRAAAADVLIAESANVAAPLEDSEIELPELQDEIVDDEVIGRLFDDLAALGQIIEINEMGGARAHSEGVGLDLEIAKRRFLAGDVRGVQIVYRHQDETWCDTLMRVPSGTRILRMLAPTRVTHPV
jgi:MauM/NapG family ferredoxin protein